MQPASEAALRRAPYRVPLHANVDEHLQRAVDEGVPHRPKGRALRLHRCAGVVTIVMPRVIEESAEPGPAVHSQVQPKEEKVISHQPSSGLCKEQKRVRRAFGTAALDPSRRFHECDPCVHARPVGTEHGHIRLHDGEESLNERAAALLLEERKEVHPRGERHRSDQRLDPPLRALAEEASARHMSKFNRNLAILERNVQLEFRSLETVLSRRRHSKKKKKRGQLNGAAAEPRVHLVPLARYSKETHWHVPLRLLCAGEEVRAHHLRRPLDAPNEPGVEPVTRLQQVVHKSVCVVRDGGKRSVARGGEQRHRRRRRRRVRRVEQEGGGGARERLEQSVDVRHLAAEDEVKAPAQERPSAAPPTAVPPR